jgi:inorganic pyrophosphatase
MATESYLQKTPKFQIQAYEKPKDLKIMRKTHVSFSGSPQKHPYDAHRVILVVDPFSTDNLYYEFKKEDISYVEELPNITNQDGETTPMVRVWVKKMSVGIRCSPFIVEDTKKTA